MVEVLKSNENCSLQYISRRNAAYILLKLLEIEKHDLVFYECYCMEVCHVRVKVPLYVMAAVDT